MTNSLYRHYCLASHVILNSVDTLIAKDVIISWFPDFTVLQRLNYIVFSDHFWSAFCVFHAHFWGEKTHSFRICALKKRNDFRQLKRSNFRVEKCKRKENLSKFLNTMAYKTVTSMRDCVMKRIVFILIKCICFIIKINHMWSRVKRNA